MIRLRDSFLRPFQAPVDVLASQEGRVYLFREVEGDSDQSSEDEFNVMELRPRGREQASLNREKVGDVLLLEKDISEGDNLNKLALQYGCKVADIKRVNNLIREQDLYALKVIKIPVKKHSVLTETSNDLKEPQASSSRCLHMLAEPSLYEDAAAAGRCGTDIKECTDFLKEIDHDIERLIQSTDNLEEVSCLEPHDGPPHGTGNQNPSPHGSDWGIQWWNAVALMLLIGIILPVFYVVYFKTQDSRSAFQDTANSLNVSSPTSDCLEINVADIKRVNNLIREQDLYALKVIKIPVKKHSVLTETSNDLKEPQASSSRCLHMLAEPSLYEDAAAAGRCGTDIKECTDFLKEIDHDIERLIQSTDNLEEVSCLEPHDGPPHGTGNQNPSPHGSDWGIQWWNAVALMLLIGIILPVFYVVYFKTQDSRSAFQDTANSLNVSSPTSDCLEINVTALSPGKSSAIQKNSSSSSLSSEIKETPNERTATLG
ncbi:LysM and putative peptidoglycan-binding domain-containing protein 4 [Acipenser ruthenus]|uniref:LysM and putative peptidoglycan-binding domain-containing protein 4 n=1 Tax=Acipenser ruthenus TaxID=7906 RepID=A0A444UT63_ACIRT|nr:LysM and putative peptidoglycan-binding domain-containing protein 4 [Acipenser ruthenus]